ncbi:MAG: hypothetical protein PHO84_05480 [Dysgonamonadaceae bacterium]|jgi:hypothetical protein|nr:hypothetical protein [Dysgonamonadaceae bacterium]MDD3356853.1 hypothetical protein [Dysgonamonadaceae bacterium]MDD3728473.1 hypothetical protein [Dysgonamonadaceae bacterium]MDD4246590.1 hypothetical protein [Dysgonamonadaceae bacterium]MDD4605877.1 hypothetical protein [Dysgonamonadaceae bacterium]
MKSKTIKSIKQVTFILLLLVIGYSCSDDDPVQVIDFQETQWDIVNITVKKANWEWINNAGRYEAVFDLPELTKFIYENGAQLGYVFIGQEGVDEVQKMLPFVHTYYEGEDEEGFPVLYTETISCDFMYGSPSTVAFYIQASDLGRDDSILADYNFRIVLIW